MAADPMGDVRTGVSTARVPVPADAAEQARLAATQARARHNLAVMAADRHGVDRQDPYRDFAIAWAADEFAELAACLGLDPAPERRPGYCACGTVLPLSSASTSCTGTYGDGQCVVCTRKARAS